MEWDSMANASYHDVECASTSMNDSDSMNNGNRDFSRKILLISKTNGLIERLVNMHFKNPEKKQKVIQLIKSLMECFDDPMKNKRTLDKEIQTSFISFNSGKSHVVDKDAKISNDKTTQTDILGCFNNFNIPKVQQCNETSTLSSSRIDEETLGIIKYIKLLQCKIKNNRDSLHYPTLLGEVQYLLKKCQNTKIETTEENINVVNFSKQEKNDNLSSKYSQNEHLMYKTEIQTMKQTSDINQSYCSNILNDIQNKIKRLEDNGFCEKNYVDQATQISTQESHKDNDKSTSLLLEEMKRHQKCKEPISQSNNYIADNNMYMRDKMEICKTADFKEYLGSSTDKQTNSNLSSDNQLNNSFNNIHSSRKIFPSLQEYLLLTNSAYINPANMNLILNEITTRRGKLQMGQKRQFTGNVLSCGSHVVRKRTNNKFDYFEMKNEDLEKMKEYYRD